MNAEGPIAGKLRFDPVVTWGHVLLFFGFLVSGAGVWVATELRANDLAYRIASLERTADKAEQATKDVISELKSLNKELINIKIIVARDDARSALP